MLENMIPRVAVLTAAAIAILAGDRVAAGSPTTDDRELFQLEAEFEAALDQDRAATAQALVHRG